MELARNEAGAVRAGTRHVKRYPGETWYVDAVGGDNNNSGTHPDSAVQTITQAHTLAANGDTITVKAGTYTEVGLDISKDGIFVDCAEGVILDPATGTVLTVSGDHVKVQGSLTLTPAADTIGCLVSGEGCRLNNTNIIGALMTTGLSVTGDTFDGENIKVTGVKATGWCFSITGEKTGLLHCGAYGAGLANYGFHINGNVGRAYRCFTVGCGTSGYYIATGVTGWTVMSCVSGGGDGRWLDVDAANVWSDFVFADAPTKTLTFDGTGGTSHNLFKVTGTVVITRLYADVATALNADVGSSKLESYDGAAVDITTAVDISSAPINSFIGKFAGLATALGYKPSGTAAMVDWTSEYWTAFTLMAKEGADTFIRLNHANNPTDGALHWHCEWRPLTDDGFVEAV
ncbi:MAG: hypothetical protein GY838_12775 [bacterium]|nr:hypothetical protein [bacterium]